ncbi:MAG: alpha/beta hydrolase [Bacteroidota bacterium]
MKRLVLIASYYALPVVVSSQPPRGIMRDTSYTISSAYQSTIKTYPQIKIAAPFHSPSITEKYNITYCKNGKRKMLLDAFYPTQKNSRPQPAILIIHGGGWRSGDKTLHHPMAQRLAGLGYICFTPEYRLASEALYPAAVYDLKAAVRWIRKNAKRYNIDVTHIAVAGHSAGGELAAFIGATNGNPLFEGNGGNTKFSSRADAVIDIDGLLAFIHPESGEGDDSKRISAATNWFGASKTTNPELWKQGSPLTHAGKNTVPTLFINSDAERMHAGRDDYITILQSNNIYNEVHHFDKSPHLFCLFDPWFEPTIKYMDDFLKKIFKK